jgi:Holliday junction resolvase RusA-like endonuclease
VADWLELTLPQPPSVNRMMAHLGNRSPAITSWVRQADMTYVLARSERPLPPVRGKFEIEIAFERDRSDFHNRLKPLFDFLQRLQLIENDRLCEHLDARWGEPGTGCKVRIRPWTP